jgi:hypothetical protein
LEKGANPVEPPVLPWLFSLLLFGGMLIMLEIGHRVGVKHRAKDPDGDKGGLGTVEGAVFALFGLMIAFTFSGAALRFNEKRMLIAEEANTIETAYLRLQLLPIESRPQLQGLFRRYLDSRLETYRRMPDFSSAEKEMFHTKKIQEEIWAESLDASRRPEAHPDAGKLLLPALNAMIDITTTRTMALQIHPPRIIHTLLFCLGLLCSLLAGYRMSSSKHRSWLHILAFVVITVAIVYVVLDVEYPRAGLFRLEAADQVLVNVRQAMN